MDTTKITTYTRDELIVGTVHGITTYTNDGSVTYRIDIIDGWTRAASTPGTDGRFSTPARGTRSSIAAVLRAVAHDDDARAFAVNAHIKFVRLLRATACMSGRGADALRARATQQAHALTRALAEHGRALPDPDVLDPRKDTRPVVAA